MSEMRKQGNHRQFQGKNNYSKSGKIRGRKKIKCQGKRNLCNQNLKMNNLKIISEHENPLFGRKEITIEIVSLGSVKKSEAEKIISEEFSTPEDCVAIKKIFGNFGSNIFHISFFVYDSKEAKEKTELKPKKAA